MPLRVCRSCLYDLKLADEAAVDPCGKNVMFIMRYSSGSRSYFWVHDSRCQLSWPSEGTLPASPPLNNFFQITYQEELDQKALASLGAFYLLYLLSYKQSREQKNKRNLMQALYDNCFTLQKQ